MVERNVETVLGFVAGAIGILSTPVTFLLPLFDATRITAWTYFSLLADSVVGTTLSIVGFIAAQNVRSRPKSSGVTMLIIGSLGIFVGLGFWIGSLLFIAAGMIALTRKGTSR